jgi:3-oxoacyl-[acyl-carrier protein] reductase
MDLALGGKVALVAGGSRGIGAAAARLLAQEGAVVAVAARGGDGLDAMVAELGAARALAITADFSRSADADAAVEAVVRGFGRLDVLVVSIGAAQGGLFWELDDPVWTTAFDLKFMGMVRLLRAAAPVMKAQGCGSIVVVVGNNGRQPGARMLPGSAANAACLAVVKGLGDELAPYGVRVNAVNPGPTRTDRWDVLMRNLAAGSGRSVAEEEAEQFARIPIGRIGDPAEVAVLIALLASERSATVAGASITADGGATKALA